MFIKETESWLKFNYRVLNESKRKIHPILERLKFVGIADSNLDEFIRTKYMGDKETKALVRTQSNAIDLAYDNLIEELKEYDINIVNIDYIKKDEELYSKAKDIFKKQLFPLIQPLIISNKLPLPDMCDGGSFIISHLNNDNTCIIMLPKTSLQKINVDDKVVYTTSDEMIEEFLNEFYYGADIEKNIKFRVLKRVSNLIGDGESPYIDDIKKQLKNRQNAEIVIIDCIDSDKKEVKQFYDENTTRRNRKYVFGLSFLKDISEIINGKKYYYPKLKQQNPIDGKNIFKKLDEHDILVHFPYDSFDDSAVRFIEEAAADKNVLSIKQTLYRVSKNSRIIKALCDAATIGKQVVVLIELKAKMDEKNNYELIKVLKDAGCYVIFGPTKLKTHCKTTLVIRKEKDGEIAKYVNISTGNFNENTARAYEDISYFAKEDKNFKIGEDICELFNYLGSCSNMFEETNHLLIAPISFRSGIVKNINECIQYKKINPTSECRIIIKTNAFTDKKMIEEIYNASKCGVKVDLIVRGVCSLVPGVEGLSENVTVKSVIGRFLEHSRIYEFIMGDIHKTYIGSGDMMERNLDNRVEVIMPVNKNKKKDKLHKMLELYLKDEVCSYILTKDGEYIPPKDEGFNVQSYFVDSYDDEDDDIDPLML